MTINISIGDRTFQYDTDFVLDGEDSNPLKSKLHLRREGRGEGIWMFIHPEDKADYDNDVRDGDFKRLGILINASLAGIPWGAYVPYKLNGDERPSTIFERVFDTEQDPQYHPEMWRRLMTRVPTQLVEYHKKCLESGREDYAEDWVKWATEVASDQKSEPHPELITKIKEAIAQCSTNSSEPQKV